MPFDYVTVDVFTDTAFHGNPVAVITDARGPSTDQMQAIANEFNYSETTFVLPPEDPKHTARIRIFTQIVELPFAGHPNSGTAFDRQRLGELFGQPIGKKLVFEEIAGLVEIGFLQDRGIIVGAMLSAPQKLSLGSEISPEIVTECLLLSREEILTENHEPVVGSVALPFVLVELIDRRALKKAQRNGSAINRHFPMADGTDVIFAYAKADHGERIDIYARMVDVINEDPATGSACAALGGLLAQLDPRKDAEMSFKLRQGVEMGRPSDILCEVEKTDGAVGVIRVGGRCVEVMRGTIDPGDRFLNES